MGLENIFVANLQYRPDMEAIVPTEGRDGELVGSAEGDVRGQVNGKLRVSIFEKVGEDFCQMHPAGLIETDDGVSIPFDAKGFATRRTSFEWDIALALKFEATDARYEWLNSTVALLEGEFSEATGQVAWRVYGRSAA